MGVVEGMPVKLWKFTILTKNPNPGLFCFFLFSFCEVGGRGRAGGGRAWQGKGGFGKGVGAIIFI